MFAHVAVGITLTFYSVRSGPNYCCIAGWRQNSQGSEGMCPSHRIKRYNLSSFSYSILPSLSLPLFPLHSLLPLCQPPALFLLPLIPLPSIHHSLSRSIILRHTIAYDISCMPFSQDWLIKISTEYQDKCLISWRSETTIIKVLHTIVMLIHTHAYIMHITQMC